MFRMVDWTLRERLEAKTTDVEDVVLSVQMWLRSCAQQAEKDGSSATSKVLEELAIHLKHGAV